MSLAALDSKGIKHISYELKPVEYRQSWTCPNCRDSMFFVNSRLRIKHFRHAIYNNCEPEPETSEHVALKQFIYTFLAEKGYECNYEVKIGNRIADVTFKNTKTGKLRVVECQISLISNFEAQQRVDDYLKEKVHEVYWVLYPKNYLVLDNKFKVVFRLKDIERANMDSPRLLYFDPKNQQIKKLYFKRKWMRGRKSDLCNTLFLKEDDELIIKNTTITNWGIIQGWIDRIKKVQKLERINFLQKMYPGATFKFHEQL